MQLVPPATQFQTSSPGRVPLPLPEPALLEPPVAGEEPPSPGAPAESPPPSFGAPPGDGSPPVPSFTAPPALLALPASLALLPAALEEVPPLEAPEADAPPLPGSSLESELHAAAVASKAVKAPTSRKGRG